MKLTYFISFLLGVSIWFNIQSYMGYVDRKVKAAYEEGFERGKLVESHSQALERNLDMIREKLSQTPGK